MDAEGRPLPAGAAAARVAGAGACLGRGMLAGLGAGLVTGLLQLVVGEPSVERAIALEHAASGGHSQELFTRGLQHAGMVMATSLYGVALGGVLAVIFFVMSRRMQGSAWDRGLKIALAGFASFWLPQF